MDERANLMNRMK
ncbi:hypothetical protein XELAEV_180171173mg, partial [Xenopus laevis]